MWRAIAHHGCVRALNSDRAPKRRERARTLRLHKQAPRLGARRRVAPPHAIWHTLPAEWRIETAVKEVRRDSACWVMSVTPDHDDAT